MNLPAKSYAGDDGVTHWQPLITIEGKSAYWRFQDLALAAIDRYLGAAGVVIEQLAPEQRQHMDEITRPWGLKEGAADEKPF